MADTCVNLPPDRIVVVLDDDRPGEVADALIDAAVAANLPVRVVQYAPEVGGFYVPALIANTDTTPPPPGPGPGPVDPGAAVLTSISPNPASTPAGQPWLVTVVGTGFLQPLPGYPQAPHTTQLRYSQDNWATWHSAGVIAPHTDVQFTANLPATDPPGTYQVRVVTADLAGGGPAAPELKSNLLPLTLVHGG